MSSTDAIAAFKTGAYALVLNMGKGADPAATLQQLLAEREPVYARSDITVQSREVPHDAIVAEIMRELAALLNREVGPSERPVA